MKSLIEPSGPVKKKVLVASHERSGTHFLINTIAQNFGYEANQIDLYLTVAKKPSSANLSAMYDSFRDQLLRIRNRTEVRVFKTHLPFPLFEPVLDDFLSQYVIFYIYRDGRDTLTSLWHMLKRMGCWHDVPKTETVGEFIRAFPSGKALIHYHDLDHSDFVRRWVSHVEGWMTARGVHLISYEELHEDFKGTVEKKIAPPLGGAPSTLARPSLSDHTVKPWRGVIGNWKEFFTEEDERFFSERASEIMRRLGYSC